MLGSNEEVPIKCQTCKNLRKWPLIQETEETLVSSSALSRSEILFSESFSRKGNFYNPWWNGLLCRNQNSDTQQLFFVVQD